MASLHNILIRHILKAAPALILLISCVGTGKESGDITLQNPILPGYFADPSLVQYDGRFYLYATADPWGTDFLSCWVSDDFQDWTFHRLNWPTKSACTSPLSSSSMVWAPSVIEKDGAFYMYVSVGSEVWCGTAEHPLGPWRNMLDNRPMISHDTTRYYHVIDAEAFIDDDNRAYLYWGSGWDWTNGHCFAAELDGSMAAFKTEPVEVTPAHYFEAPWMIKRNGVYYLTYSEGKTIDETYEIRYAAGTTPFGPFTEADNSPILTTNDSLQVYGPGHHTFFTFRDKDYVLYHRHRLPFEPEEAYRQTCLGEITFNVADKEINRIIPSGTQKFPDLSLTKKQYIRPESVTATSTLSESTKALNAADNSYGTLWVAAPSENEPALTASFGKDIKVNNIELRLEYPWQTYHLKVESSADGNNWETVADYTEAGISGSPVNVGYGGQCGYIRVTFFHSENGPRPALWEVAFY